MGWNRKKFLNNELNRNILLDVFPLIKCILK